MIGELVTSATPQDVLVVYGIGSCIVVCLYDPFVKAGGMLHALLPTPVGDNKTLGSLTKFVDQGVPLLINSLVALGANPLRLAAYLCGGARILTAPGFKDALNIGERNIATAKTALQVAGLTVRSESTGGYVGRTVKLYIMNGQVTVKTLGQEEQLIEVRSKK